MADTLTRRRRGDVVRGRRAPQPPALVASAQIVRPSRRLIMPEYDWQRELWAFYKSLGEYRFATLWRAHTMSRVRLTAAVMRPGGEEPEILTEGKAAEIVRGFFGGAAGQSDYMKRMSTQLDVPGEGYVVAWDDLDAGKRRWCVKSKTEIRPTSGRVNVDGVSRTVDLWEIEVDEGAWQRLPFETFVFRQWRPDDEKSWRADSPARAALSDMRTLLMLDRRVTAMSVSRLASNGVLLYPNEVTFPAKPGYEEAPDAFTAEWLDIAGKVIADPGSALAALPLPLKVPKEYIDSFKHMDFANTYDEKLVELIREYRDKVAGALPVPKEIVTGMGDTSHWNAWTLDEQGIKVHVAPDAELIVDGLTDAYLHPALIAEGESLVDADGGQIMVWYDTSELMSPPDRTESAKTAHGEFAITTDAYLRELGLDVADRPSPAQLREQILIKLAQDPAQAAAAMDALGLPGKLPEVPSAGATTGPGGVDGGTAPEPAPPADGPPEPPQQSGQASSVAHQPTSV